MKFYGKIERGILRIINLQRVNGQIRELGRDGLVEIDMEFKDQRSDALNAYFHGILVVQFRMALRSIGYRVRTDAQAKKVMKDLFLDGDDTSTLSNEEMRELIDEVIQFAAEWLDGYQIAYPNELYAGLIDKSLKK